MNSHAYLILYKKINMLRESGGVGYKPSDFGYSPRERGSIEEKKSAKKANGKYSYSKPLHRLQYESQIKPLFNCEPRKIGYKYYGKIAEIEAKIIFNRNSSCRLYAKTEMDLDKLSRKIKESLIDKLV